ncbi:hypothetical protein CCM_02541 [Cordyceps militaris CM01]|uniref:Uncharacterized protein n=1 Tax=Cordyceps militaris (strain CM01) TaxID=983644 RepID=G3JAA0_CORMM|nr:uncharacterized protein CCM_02541 [Cordyceps militaris CM01]EGX94270.1 hypothetical protein CCM_02541 [Cordyceps militaris CM01]
MNKEPRRIWTVTADGWGDLHCTREQTNEAGAPEFLEISHFPTRHCKVAGNALEPMQSLSHDATPRAANLDNDPLIGPLVGCGVLSLHVSDDHKNEEREDTQIASSHNSNGTFQTTGVACPSDDPPTAAAPF